LAIITLLALVNSCPQLLADPLSPQKISDLRQDAAAFEAKREWGHAALAYAEILASDRSDADAHDHYRVCLRHLHQSRRLRDMSFHDELIKRDLAGALDTYRNILQQVMKVYVDEKKVTPDLLFEAGIHELRFALEDPAFVDLYLSRADPDKIRDFADDLMRSLARPAASIDDARKQLEKIALKAAEKLQLPGAVVVIEFAYGACNGLDEYSVCLTPSQYKELIAGQHGDIGTVGIDLVTEDRHVVVANVALNSPAATHVKPHDQIVAVDGKPVENLTAEGVKARLRGPLNSVTELTYSSSGETKTIKIERRLPLRTVENDHMLDAPGVGYFKITEFSKTTRDDVLDAIGRLSAMKMEALIIDLRDCHGGSYKAGIHTAELFLPGGVITSVESRRPELNDTFKSSNHNAFGMPIVVLVNGETASAAELFAAALRDNDHRARIVGRSNTFGKNTIQYTLTIKDLSTGMLITVAHFFPPSKQDFSGIGLVPDCLVEIKGEMTPEEILQAELRCAETIAGSLIMMPE
jgi:carboxyl-terminal processing protease